MPARVQQLAFGMGKAKQADIATASASFLKFRKLNMNMTTPKFNTETDKDEIGKGNEFITQVFGVSNDATNTVEKYGSAEWVIFCFGYALGVVSEVAGVYTITPIDPGVTIELPYFSVVEQMAEGGGSAFDNLFYGCQFEEVMYTFNYGPGRQSSKMNATFIGSGKTLTPSAVTLPAVLSEHYMTSASMAISVNGHDYVSDKTMLSGSMGWKNNLLANAGYFPGSGTQNGAAIRGRLEIGNRVPSFQFTARLLHGSTELAKLLAQTSGTAVVTLTFDGTHTVTWTWEKVTFQSVDYTEADGIVAVSVIVAPQFDTGSNTVLQVTGQCGVPGIAQ